MNNLLKYLFSFLPGAHFKFYNEALIFIGVLIIGAIISKIILKRYKNAALKKHFGNMPRHLVLFAGLFGFLIFSRYEQIMLFSMRFILYVSLIGFLIWTGKQIYVFFARYRKDNRRLKEMAKIPRYSTKKYK